jgi:hypothetical protein
MQNDACKRFLPDNFLLSFPKKIDSYTKKGNKFSEQVSRCQYGGLYETNIDGIKYTVLFKQGRNDGETICEFLSTFIYNLIIPRYSSKVFLSKVNYFNQSKQYKNGFHDQKHSIIKNLTQPLKNSLNFKQQIRCAFYSLLFYSLQLVKKNYILFKYFYLI